MIGTSQATLVVENGETILIPSFPDIEKMLTLRIKKLGMVTDRKTKRQRRELIYERKEVYRLVPAGASSILVTYEGFWEKIQKRLTARGVTVNLIDRRVAYPNPLYTSMSGFRFSQQALLYQALMQGHSGLIGAPTRYGKTTLMINTARAFPTLCTVVTAPGADLTQQLYQAFKAALPHRNIVMLGAGSRAKFPSEDITVCCMDSLHRCDTGRTELMLIDEPHASVTTERIVKIVEFEKARKYGFGATLKGRFDGKDALIEGLIGPVLAERTYQEAVAEGAICPLVVLGLNLHVDPRRAFYNRDQAYNALLFRNPHAAQVVAKIAREIVPADWQTLIFIKNEKQAELYAEEIGPEGTIIMAKRLTNKEREALTDQMRKGEIQRCLASNIYSQGVTFPDVRVLINTEGGGDNTSAIQKPGRLAEIRPNKACGIIIDLIYTLEHPETIDNYSMSDHKWLHLIKDSEARLRAYRRLGYHVEMVNDLSELQAAFQQYSEGRYGNDTRAIGDLGLSDSPRVHTS